MLFVLKIRKVHELWQLEFLAQKEFTAPPEFTTESEFIGLPYIHCPTYALCYFIFLNNPVNK